MRFISVISSLAITLFSLNGLAKENSDSELTLPQVIQDKNPLIRHIPTNRYNNEKWMYLNFKVNREGALSDHKVLNHSGDPGFIDETLRYLEKVKYSPATLSGRKVDGHIYVLMTESIARPNRFEHMVSRGFKKNFVELHESLTAGELEQSAALIEKLDDRNKRQTENAWLSWMKSAYHQQNGDMQAYYREIKIADLLGDKSLPSSVAGNSLLNLFEFQLNNHLLADAFQTVEKIKQSARFVISDEGIQNLRKQINDIQRQRQGFAISHILKPSEAFYHNAYSDTVSVKAISGEITDAEMRCIGKSKKADVGQLNQGKSWTFNNIYPQCAIFVSGSEGTEIQLSGEWQEESGNLWAARDNTSKLHQRLSRYVLTDISRR